MAASGHGDHAIQEFRRKLIGSRRNYLKWRNRLLKTSKANKIDAEKVSDFLSAYPDAGLPFSWAKVPISSRNSFHFRPRLGCQLEVLIAPTREVSEVETLHRHDTRWTFSNVAYFCTTSSGEDQWDHRILPKLRILIQLEWSVDLQPTSSNQDMTHEPFRLQRTHTREGLEKGKGTQIAFDICAGLSHLS